MAWLNDEQKQTWPQLFKKVCYRWLDDQICCDENKRFKPPESYTGHNFGGLLGELAGQTLAQLAWFSVDMSGSHVGESIQHGANTKFCRFSRSMSTNPPSTPLSLKTTTCYINKAFRSFREARTDQNHFQNPTQPLCSYCCVLTWSRAPGASENLWGSDFLETCCPVGLQAGGHCVWLWDAPTADAFLEKLGLTKLGICGAELADAEARGKGLAPWRALAVCFFLGGGRGRTGVVSFFAGKGGGSDEFFCLFCLLERKRRFGGELWKGKFWFGFKG